MTEIVTGRKYRTRSGEVIQVLHSQYAYTSPSRKNMISIWKGQFARHNAISFWSKEGHYMAGQGNHPLDLVQEV